MLLSVAATDLLLLGARNEGRNQANEWVACKGGVHGLGLGRHNGGSHGEGCKDPNVIFHYQEMISLTI